VIEIYPYQTQAVRDLAWAVFSPNLVHIAALPNTRAAVHDCHFELTTRRRLWLEQLDRNSDTLAAHLAQRSTHRLGLYFEQLWHFFLSADPEVELIAHNLPIRDEGRTLGEFDVIYFCQRRDTHVHLELAVKYYLGANPQTEEPIWLGPDRRDHLDNKLVHLLHRQIGLSDAPAASARLQELGIDSLEREISLKGYLFQPLQDPLRSPQAYNRECVFGHWAHLGLLDRLTDSLQDNASASHFMRLQKMQWLSPAQTNPASILIPPTLLQTEVAALFADIPYPVLIAALDAHGSETARFFVTPDSWPEQP
jgi:hypothetical protein